MSLDLQQISPKLKSLLLDLKNLSPVERFVVVSQPREELKWKTVAFLYGIEKLEAQGWMIPDDEINQTKLTTKDTKEREGKPNQPQMNAGAPEKEDPAVLEARMEQENAEGVRRAVDLNAQMDRRDHRWSVKTIPEDAQLSKLPNFYPEYVLADDGHVEHVITVRHALEREIRQRLGVPEAWRPDAQKIAWHKEQLRRLEKADQSPRCEHVYMDGTGCRAPRLKDGRLCYAHERMERVRPKKLRLLAPEDANAIVVNLMEIGRALVDEEISERKAGLLMYQQQLALIALKQVTFKTTNPALMVREMPESPESHGIARNRRNLKSETPVRRRSTQKNADQDKALTAKNAKSAGRDCQDRRNCQTSPEVRNETQTPTTEAQRKSGDRVIGRSGDPESHITTKDTKGGGEVQTRKSSRSTPGLNPVTALDSGFHPSKPTSGLPGTPVVPHKPSPSTPGLNPVTALDSGLTGLNGGGQGVAARKPAESSRVSESEADRAV